VRWTGCRTRFSPSVAISRNEGGCCGKWYRTGWPIAALLTRVKNFSLNRDKRAEEQTFWIGRAGAGCMAPATEKTFEFTAEWDPEAGVWWCSNDDLPVTTEAPTFDELVARVMEIAPEIAAVNGAVPPGEQIKIRVTGERVQSAPVLAAA
jgi:Domain of unknown function (DUF1902)